MRILLIILAMHVSGLTIGQINVGSKEKVTKTSGKLKKEDYNFLKNSKTIFVYRESDKGNLEQFKSVLKSAWDYNEIEFVSLDKLKDLEKSDKPYTYFTLGGFHKDYYNDKMQKTREATYVYLTLWAYNGKKTNTYCRIEMHPDFKTYETAGILAGTSDMLVYLYDTAILSNWTIAYLKNALEFVSEKLKNEENRWLYSSYSKGNLKPLKKNILYVPEYALTDFKIWTGDESEKQDERELFSKYLFKYKIISNEELSNLILESQEPIYYLSLIKSSSDKYISIINGSTGEFIYTDYSAMSYNMKKKDLGKISKQIAK